MRIQRTDAVGKFLGQHGHGAIRKIDGSAAQARLAIERRIAAHVVRHVGDVHLQLAVAVRQRADVNGVVEIARRFAVNGDDGQVAEIAAARADPLPPPAADAARASASTSSGNSCGR